MDVEPRITGDISCKHVGQRDIDQLPAAAGISRIEGQQASCRQHRPALMFGHAGRQAQRRARGLTQRPRHGAHGLGVERGGGQICVGTLEAEGRDDADDESRHAGAQGGERAAARDERGGCIADQDIDSAESRRPLRCALRQSLAALAVCQHFDGELQGIADRRRDGVPCVIHQPRDLRTQAREQPRSIGSGEPAASTGVFDDAHTVGLATVRRPERRVLRPVVRPGHRGNTERVR